MKRSCSLFFYEGYVGVAPTVINLSKFLNKAGYSVTIYATQNYHFSSPSTIGDNTTVIYFRSPDDIAFLSKTLDILYKVKLATLIPVIEFLWFILSFSVHIIKHHKLHTLQHDISIGIDTYGSILAFIKASLLRQQYLYLSLELNHPEIFKGFARIFPILERIAYRRSKGVIVQDKYRFKTLGKYNRYQHSNVFFLPNSASSSENSPPYLYKNNYFRELFDLNEEEFPYIILQTGMIDDLAFSKSLASAFVSINKGCALVFHERVGRGADDPYIKALREINSRNLFLSLTPLPYEQIDTLYASATIGLAFYKGVDHNFSQISMASGKLSYYLKHGKPVLVNNLESLSELVKMYQFGVVIKDPSAPLEITSAIEAILNNYSFYSKNAKICFEEEFDFAKKIVPVLSFIGEL